MRWAGPSPEARFRGPVVLHLGEDNQRPLSSATTASGVREGTRRAPPQPDGRRTRAVVARLKRTYQSPRLGNKTDPLDELVYIILSNRTSERSYADVFHKLKRRFPAWDDLHGESHARLSRILRPAGLSRLKARQMHAIIRILRRRFGYATLDPLRRFSDSEAEAFLTALPGVGKKVAKCVMMYSLGRLVLPVDVHVHRVATRLGYQAKRRPDTSQDLIERAIPPKLRYDFHVNAVAHGRAVCRPRRPACGECVLTRWCRFYQQDGGAHGKQG